MLKDSDATVRLAAIQLLTANLAPQVIDPVAAQLSDSYEPIHQAALAALSSSGEVAVRQACIDAAVRLLDDAQAPRRQDGSYVLGHYRSDAALERHIALAAAFDGAKPDWPVVAQAAASLGRIGRPEAKAVLLSLAASKPEKCNNPQTETATAIGNAMVACGQLGEKRVLPACHTALAGNPQMMPSILRTGAAFAIGAVGSEADTGAFGGVMSGAGATYESPATRLEVLRAIGNLRAKSQLDLTKAETIRGIEEQWMAHWAHDRITGQATPFQPKPDPWLADVSITDLSGQP
jgi:HEAT repeat protein